MRTSILPVLLVALSSGTTAAAQAPGHASHPHPVSDGLPLSDGRLEHELNAVREATARYQDLDAARADGYIRFGRAEGPLMGEHWYRRDLVHRPLDLAQPSTLQYAVIDGRRVLVGVAYTLYRAPADPMPDGFAGDADRWHVHDVRRIARIATEGRPLLRWLVERRSPRGDRTLLTMVHAWVWLQNPDGMFADQHPVLPYLRAGLPAHYANGGTVNSAWGVALLDDKTCRWEMNRIDRLTRPSRAQLNVLKRGCEAAAERVRRVRGAGEVELNREAAEAWREYEALRTRTLTEDQRARLAAMVEHPH